MKPANQHQQDIQCYVLDDSSRFPIITGHLRNISGHSVINLLPMREALAAPALVFAHANDVDKRRSRMGPLFSQALSDGGLLVFYAGSGEPRVLEVLQAINLKLSRQICIISRKVTRQDALTEAEIKTIYQEIRYLKNGWEFDNPDCLRIPQRHFLEALALLCQTYLLAHQAADAPDAQKQSSPYLARVSEKLIEHHALVKQPEWWKAVFSGYSDSECLACLELEWYRHTRQPLPDLLIELWNNIAQNIRIENTGLIRRCHQELMKGHPRDSEISQ